MIYIIIILISFCILLMGYIFMVHKELTHITKQLRAFLNGKTGQKASIELFSKKINRLLISINELIEINIRTDIQMQNAQQELRQGIANMSHDLRTPLTSILGYIQLLEDSELSQDEIKSYIHILHDRALRLHTLINDFFELSVIDSSEHILEKKPLNLTNIVKETLLDHYETMSKTGIKPILSGMDKTYTILADEVAVRRVIENLMGNALKYCEGNISVSLIGQDNFVEFCISNNTVGLSRQDIPMMFDRFYIADKTRSGQSNGLGLPIVKSLMKKMDGTVTAHMNGDTLFITCQWQIPHNNCS